MTLAGFSYAQVGLCMQVMRYTITVTISFMSRGDCLPNLYATLLLSIRCLIAISTLNGD